MKILILQGRAATYMYADFIQALLQFISECNSKRIIFKNVKIG